LIGPRRTSSGVAANGAALLTGGTYSVWRILFGLFLLVRFALLLGGAVSAGEVLWIALWTLGVAAAILLALGAFDRPAAAILAGLWLAVPFREPLALPDSVAIVLLLLGTLFIPPAPYGSVAARGRVDPAGSWRMPQPVVLVMWIALATGYVHSLARFPSIPLELPDGAAKWIAWGGMLFVSLLLSPLLRPFAWAAILLVQLGLLAARHPFAAGPGMVFLHLFTFDPAWIPPREGRDEIVFYDGSCGLCHGFIRFLLAEDAAGTLRFAALQGDTFAALVPEEVRRTLPDSVVVRRANGDVLVKSSAALHLLARLGGLWRAAGTVAGIFPKALLDRLYDGVAAVRYRVFGRKKDACPLMPPALRKRFAG